MKIKFIFLAFGIFQKPDHFLPYKKAKRWLTIHFPTDVYYGCTDDVNCEHIIPRSLLKLKKHPLTDLHCLVLSNAKLNSHRQNFGFASISGDSTILLDDYGQKTTVEYAFCKKDMKQQKFEPPTEQKGRIARMVGYYLWTYHGAEMIPGLIEKKSMLRWHFENPVSRCEIRKNNLVYEIQNNKNLFISYPQLMPICFSKPIVFLRKCFRLCSLMRSRLLRRQSVSELESLGSPV